MTLKTITKSSARPSDIHLINIYDRPDRNSFLYELLLERDETVNISHKTLPCWGDHIRFIESKPYEAWYCIIADGKTVGACYLTRQNEIGVHLFKTQHGRGIGRRAVEILMRKHPLPRYLANVNPRNERSAALFSSMGFKIIQHTYESL